MKQRMGTTDSHRILAGTGMTTESLSTEVLRSPRIDVRERLGADPAAAVITVPETRNRG